MQYIKKLHFLHSRELDITEDESVRNSAIIIISTVFSDKRSEDKITIGSFFLVSSKFGKKDEEVTVKNVTARREENSFNIFMRKKGEYGINQESGY